MISSKFFSSLAPVITLVVIALGGWMWWLDRNNSMRWIVGMGFLPAAWAIIWLLQRNPVCKRVIEGGKYDLMSGISLGGLMLAGSFGLKIAQQGHIIEDSSPDRLVAVLLGVFMVVLGNALPKKLEPFNTETCSAPQTSSLKRFAGWMFVLSGFGYAMAWIVLPEKLADIVALPILAGPIVLVMIRTAWAALNRTKISH